MGKEKEVGPHVRWQGVGGGVQAFYQSQSDAAFFFFSGLSIFMFTSNYGFYSVDHF